MRNGIEFNINIVLDTSTGKYNLSYSNQYGGSTGEDIRFMIVSDYPRFARKLYKMLIEGDSQNGKIFTNVKDFIIKPKDVSVSSP